MRALFCLLRLQGRGVSRRLLRGARTPRGSVFLILGALVLVLWMGPALWGSFAGPRVDPQQFRDLGPLVLLAFCLATLVSTASDRAVTFSPAEVDFLFPGPFTRHQLLGFKLLKSLFGALLTALLFSVILRRYVAWWPAVYAGALLTLLFIQLFSMTVVLVGQTVGERAYTRGRKLLAVAVIVAVALPLLPLLQRGPRLDGPDLLAAVRGSAAGQAVLAPFEVFTRAIAAEALAPGLLLWGGAALGIDLALLGVVFWLDAHFLETSLATSHKVYERLRRVRRGGLGALHARPTATWRLPQFPPLGGAGPIAWRHLTAALRSSRGLLLMLLIMAIAVAPATLLGSARQADPARRKERVEALLGVIAWLNIFFASMLKFDFRDELEHMDWLKSLPLRPLAVAAGELIAPVIVMTGAQAMMLGGMAFFLRDVLGLLPVALAFFVPFNVLFFGMENVLFLLFPSRVHGLSAGDLQMFGRQSILFILKLVAVLAACGLAALAGVVAWKLTGSVTGGTGVAWLLLTAEALAAVPAVAWAFARFDPSADMPGG